MTEPHLIQWHSLGLELCARVYGDLSAGPPLLLLHGFLDQAGAFDDLAAALRVAGVSRPLVAPHHRGHGASGHVGPGGYYHFPDYVLDLHALLNALDVDRATLVGHSMGATIAAYFGGTFPERIERLVLLEGIGPAHVPPDRGPALMRRWVNDVGLRVAAEPRTFDSVDDVHKRLRRNSPRATAEQVARLAEHAAMSVDDAFGTGYRWRFDPLHQTRAPMPFDVPRFDAFLRAIVAPTLVVWAEHTPFRPADADRRQSLIRDVAVERIAGVGHNLHVEAPTQVAGCIADFLKRPAANAATGGR